MTVLLVALGAAIGATTRFWVATHLDPARGWPWGTLAVNVAGSFALGLLVGAGTPSGGLALLGTGLCGGLTTYSAYAVQTRDLARTQPALGVGYAAATLIMALAGCALGWALGHALAQA